MNVKIDEVDFERFERFMKLLDIDEPPCMSLSHDVILSTAACVDAVPDEKKDEYCALVKELLSCFYPLRCPEEGSFTAWKIGCVEPKCAIYRHLCLIELEVPEDSRRSSCYGNKCRCDKALVKSITELAAVQSNYDYDYVQSHPFVLYTFDKLHGVYFKLEETSVNYTRAYSAVYWMPYEAVYTVGEMVYADDFDENRWHECSHGIHFFMDKHEALELGLRMYGSFL